MPGPSTPTIPAAAPCHRDARSPPRAPRPLAARDRPAPPIAPAAARPGRRQRRLHPSAPHAADTAAARARRAAACPRRVGPPSLSPHAARAPGGRRAGGAVGVPLAAGADMLVASLFAVRAVARQRRHRFLPALLLATGAVVRRRRAPSAPPSLSAGTPATAPDAGAVVFVACRRRRRLSTAVCHARPRRCCLLFVLFCWQLWTVGVGCCCGVVVSRLLLPLASCLAPTLPEPSALALAVSAQCLAGRETVL